MIEGMVMMHFFGMIGGIVTGKASVLSAVASALAALAVAWFTYILTGLGRSADRNFTVTERAYVKISHEPPGVVWQHENLGRFAVVIQVKNFGRTPAQIISLSMRALVVETRAAIPPIPEYVEPERRGAFLVTDDKYGLTINLRITNEERVAVKAREGVMAVFGYIEYIDQFEQRHRAGYGRWYDPERDSRPPNLSEEEFVERTNLTYIEDVGYNYDIPIKD